MNNEQQYFDTNRQLWNEKTAHHTASAFYDMEGWLAGATSLKHPELELLGDVQGKSILHLQCHFGQDTLSLARMGAQVTGADLSDMAITEAELLAKQLNLNAQFICSDVYNLPGNLQKTVRYRIYFLWCAGLAARYEKMGGGCRAFSQTER